MAFKGFSNFLARGLIKKMSKKSSSGSKKMDEDDIDSSKPVSALDAIDIALLKSYVSGN